VPFLIGEHSLAVVEDYLVAESIELAAELAAIRGQPAGALPGWSWGDRKGRWCKDVQGPNGMLFDCRVYRSAWEVVKDSGPSVKNLSDRYQSVGQGEHDFAPRATMRWLEALALVDGEFPMGPTS
jgi:hypothetical protein